MSEFPEFSANQIEKITVFLEKYCEGQSCISSVFVYDALKTEMGSISKSRFCNTLSSNINNGVIKGFSLRRGRNGGIHREGVFTGHDKQRQAESERPKRKYEKRPYKGSCCDIIVENRQYRVKISEAKVLVFILNVLDGTIDDSNPNVMVGVMKFNVSNLSILEKFITNYCGVDTQQTAN